jgi:predicted ArsR family transcriptional regulator
MEKMSALAKHIISDLSYGPSTSDSIAQRLRVHQVAIEKELAKLENAKTVRHRMICDGKLKIYHL